MTDTFGRRSFYRTDFGFFTFDRSVLYDSSVYSVTRKVLVLAALMMGLSVMVPVTHSQDGLSVGLRDMGERMSELHNAVDKLIPDVAEMRADIRNIRKDQDDQNTKNNVVIGGMVLFVIERVLSVVFGLKVKDRG